ncbi:MAG: HAD-IA family hydrolase [Trueperaceae bacterium]|nr:HAD-IA family hydrolase [Trueperaceae bacterium]
MKDAAASQASTRVPGVPVRALLFDLDGTLVHTDPVHFHAWREMLAAHGVPIDEAGYARRVSGRHNPEIIADLLPHLGTEDALAFADAKEARFRALATGLTPLPGTRALLRAARAAGLRTAVVTNAPRVNAVFMLEALGLAEAFDAVGAAEDASAAKPDAAPYREMLARLEVAPDAAWAFEDSPSGVRSARGAGVRVVGLATTQSADELTRHGAALVVNDFTDTGLWEGPLRFLAAGRRGANPVGD